MRYLLDTNAVSVLQKEITPHSAAAAWIRSIRIRDTFLSVITVGEIRRGVETRRRRDQAGALSLEAWARGLELQYERQILPVTVEIAHLWGSFTTTQPLPVADALIAATALHHGLTVVTHNVKDFERAGVAIVDPFSAN